MAVDILLGFGVSLELLCCLGVLVMRTTYDRLHYVAAATTVPAFLILAAVLVREHAFLLNPVLVIATARVARRIDGYEAPDS